jgi:hypothetical protein
VAGTPHNLKDYTCVATMDEPISFIEALQKEDGEKWRAMADEKYKSLMKNNIYELTKVPQE